MPYLIMQGHKLGLLLMHMHAHASLLTLLYEVGAPLILHSSFAAPPLPTLTHQTPSPSHDKTQPPTHQPKITWFI